jgi:hypothetical protein
MPLSEAAPRKLLHNRAISLQGYQREDGQFDVEAEIIDTKTYAFATDDRTVETGTPLHHMRARITVDAGLVITGAEAITESGPFNICGGGALTFGRLIGLTIKPGFLRAANERLGGPIGCTHIRELLQQMATVAFQTSYAVRAAQPHTNPPRMLNTCHAYAADREVVQRKWPEFYTGG